jgi:transposase-like protein
MEQRYQAVLEVRAGIPVADVARRFGVSRQAVHRWKNRYQSGGLEALADRSAYVHRLARGLWRSWEHPGALRVIVADWTRVI